MGYMQIFLHFSWITAYIWQFKAVLLQKNAEKMILVLLQKNAEKMIFYAKKFDQFKKKQYFCSGLSVRCSRTANDLTKTIDFKRI